MLVSWALRLGGAVTDVVTPHPSPAGTPIPIVSAVLKGPAAAVGEAGERDADRTGRQHAERVEAGASNRQRSGVDLRRRCRGCGRRSGR